MAAPLMTDVFKFLAVRPAQRVSSDRRADGFVRDNRVDSAAGLRAIAALADRLSHPQEARARWEALDLSPLDPLATGYVRLVEAYGSAAPEDEPDAAAVVETAGLTDTLAADPARTRELAWEALYAAHATGPSAGALLDTPLAVLRLRHFADALADAATLSRQRAMTRLMATVVIPNAFHDAFRPGREEPRPDHEASPVRRTEPETAERTAHLRALARDLVATQALLDTVANAPAVRRTGGAEEPQDTGQRWTSRFTMSTVPSVDDAVGDRLSPAEAGVLDRLRISGTTTAPEAAQVLSRHMLELTDQASAVGSDLEFQAAMQTLSGVAVVPITMSVMGGKPTAVTAAPDVDVSGRITPLGIGDLKVVKQTLLAYEAGEVAHIENVLEGEAKERTHRTLDRTEITLFTSDEQTVETERDTQSTDRFELKRESEQTIKEDTGVKAGLTVTGSYGPVVMTASGEFTYSTSKQDSEKSSSNFAREVVDKSVKKVQSKTKTERTTKTINEVEEINKHSLTNDQLGAGNISGIYRWVDKRYRAQIYNYGARLLLEFVVPEPAAYYEATRSAGTPKVLGEPPHPFVKEPSFDVAPGAVGLYNFGQPLGEQPLRAEHITETNYRRYAARYAASGVAEPPPLFKYASLAIAPKDGLGEGKSFAIASKELLVPDDYRLSSYSFGISALWVNYPKLSVQVMADFWPILSVPGGAPMQTAQRGDVKADDARATGPIALSVVCYDVLAFALNVQAVCTRTDEAMEKWRNQTFENLQTAYDTLQAAYDEKLTQAQAAAGIEIEGQNPALNRVVEKTELKKLCITMMTGQHYSMFGATQPPDDPATPPEVDVLTTLDQGPVIQFFEKPSSGPLTYLFYPYFWGRKSNWRGLANSRDPDPLFQDFLSAAPPAS